MALAVYWLQAGGCGGDTMSWLNMESPEVPELLVMLDVELLWHPSLSTLSPMAHRELLGDLTNGRRTLDVLVVEGAVTRGPGGTGMYDCCDGRPKKDLIADLARRARFVVAAGTCAAFGGVTASGPTEATGLQFDRGTPGGFLGEDFRSLVGLPVINVPGCPVHPQPLSGALVAACQQRDLPLDAYHAPQDYFGLLVHQGCTRNEYHEYRVEEAELGQRGCLFFHLGCRGPMTPGPCNKLLWNRRSSKTRVGVPCVGCTRSDFPQDDPFFTTRSIAEIPVDLPPGVDRAHYLAYKSMAAAAAPARLQNRETRV